MSFSDFLAVLGLIGTVLAIVYAVYSERKRKREQLHRQQRFEWIHVQQGVRQLCTWLRRDRFSPGILVAIPGAGLILTELVAIEMNEFAPTYVLQQLPATSDTPFDGDGVEVQTAKWRYFIPNGLLARKDKRVLIFDDYALSGDTLRDIKASLEAHGFENKKIKTAALIGVSGLRESGKAPNYVWFWADSYDVYLPWGHASKMIRTGAMKGT